MLYCTILIAEDCVVKCANIVQYFTAASSSDNVDLLGLMSSDQLQSSIEINGLFQHNKNGTWKDDDMKCCHVVFFSPKEFYSEMNLNSYGSK